MINTDRNSIAYFAFYSNLMKIKYLLLVIILLVTVSRLKRNWWYNYKAWPICKYGESQTRI